METGNRRRRNADRRLAGAIDTIKFGRFVIGKELTPPLRAVLFYVRDWWSCAWELSLEQRRDFLDRCSCQFGPALAPEVFLSPCFGRAEEGDRKREAENGAESEVLTNSRTQKTPRF